MRAVRIAAPGARPEPGTVPDPVPGAGETLVRVTAAALGHLDRGVASGAVPMAPPAPYTPGVEGAGVVVAGALPAGTPVRLRGGGLGTARDGTAAELVVAPDAAVHAVPPGLDPALVAAFFSPATSAWCALHDVAGVRAGERVAVTGARGAVGALAVQLAREAGAEVVAVSRRPGPGIVAELDPCRPVDLLVDTVGGPALPGRVAAVAPGGRAVLVGYTAGAVVPLDLPALLARDVALLPLNMVRRAPAAAIAADALLRRLAAGELRLAVTAYPLGEVVRAWDDLVGGRVDGRAVLLP